MSKIKSSSKYRRSQTTRHWLPLVVVFGVVWGMGFSWQWAAGVVGQEVQQVRSVSGQGGAANSGDVLGLADGNLEGQVVVFNIPVLLNQLVEMAELAVLGDLGVAGETNLSNTTVTGSLTVASSASFGGQLLLPDLVSGTGTLLDLGGGQITASNVVYSVEAGDGISVSGDQEVTITNDDKGSDQEIFKKLTLGDDTVEASGNEDEFTFVAGDGMILSLNTDDNELTITNNSGWTTSGSNVFLVNSTSNVGIGTNNPSAKLELDSGTAGTAGLKFSQISSSTSPAATGTGGGKVLAVDSGGNVVLVTDQTASSAVDVLPAADPGGTLYFNGVNWASSTNLYHDGGKVGISTNSPIARLHVLTNDDATIGQIIQREAGQTANLFEWRDESGTVLSYIDADGIFNGSANVAGTLDAGLSTGQVAFQGSAGLEGSNNLFWDNATGRLGVGTTSPNGMLHLYRSNSQTPLIVQADTNNVVLTEWKNAGGATLASVEVNNVANLILDDVKFFRTDTHTLRLTREGNSGARLSLTTFELAFDFIKQLVKLPQLEREMKEYALLTQNQTGSKMNFIL